MHSHEWLCYWTFFANGFSPDSVVLNCVAAVGVALLVERRSVAPNVAGSIPVSHPINWLGHECFWHRGQFLGDAGADLLDIRVKRNGFSKAWQ